MSDLPEIEVYPTRESKDFPNYHPMMFDELWDGVAPGDRFFAVQKHDDGDPDWLTLAVVTFLDRKRQIAYVMVDWDGFKPRDKRGYSCEGTYPGP